MKGTGDRAAGRAFLTARWESLVMLNYVCPRALLDPLVPAGTELDDWQGQPLISLVGLVFRRTRVLGLAIPGHRTFAEVNLRFYVVRAVAGEVRRAVVFIRELVPRRAVALVARWLYNEPYLAVPMACTGALDPAAGGRVEYVWKFRDQSYALSAVAAGPARLPAVGGEAEYITEHHWGYTRQRDGGTLEYRVDHPRWPVWEPAAYGFTAGPGSTFHIRDLYGEGFGDVLAGPPRSAHVAVGSDVVVHRGVRVPGTGRSGPA